MIKIYKSKSGETIFQLSEAVEIVNELEKYYKPKNVDMKIVGLHNDFAYYSILVKTTEDIVEF